MIDIILFEPEIPPNTGNIIRLCANSGANLHLIEPLGFSLDEKSCRRAGLDYNDLSCVTTYISFESCIEQNAFNRIFAATTKGSEHYHQFEYQKGDALLFGPETRGLPDRILEHDKTTFRVRIPMQENSRSLNLSNSVAIVLYEALRQTGFVGLN